MIINETLCGDCHDWSLLFLFYLVVLLVVVVVVVVCSRVTLLEAVGIADFLLILNFVVVAQT